MIKMMDKSCLEFLDALASSSPTPGGGGGVGMGGAMAMALTNMVCNLTIGKKKYAEVEKEIKALLKEGLELQEKLLSVVAADAEVFQPLSEAYALPNATDEEKAYKKAVLSERSKVACSVPLQGARWAVRGLEITKRVGEIGSKLVISDAGCGAAFMLAALTSARFNVMINLGAITDEAYVASAHTEINELLHKGEKLAAETVEIVENRM
ncbi:MAG: cyclodeaminase/cyclohydrolase family protein [Clostridia bacterium]|nr:cyclodeaminase/cyclohydrolase family protein [Clostridia bacterium]